MRSRTPLGRLRFQPRLSRLEDRAVPATHTWTDTAGDDLWSTAANWGADGVPTSGEPGGTVVVFPTSDATIIQDIPGLVVDRIDFTSANNTITLQTALGLAGGVTGQQLTDNSGGNTITGTSLDLSGATAVLQADTGTTTIDSSITGNQGLSNDGTGTVVFGGTNTYTGTTTVTAGTLALANGAALANAGAVAVTGGTLRLDAAETIGSLTGTGGSVSLQGGSLTTGDGNDTTYTGVVSGPNGLTKEGAGVFTLGGANTFTGTTTVTAGTLALAGGAALSDAAQVQVGAAGTVRLNADETIDTLDGSGNVDLQANRFTVGFGNNTGSYGGVVVGTGGISKVGTGSFTLSGANTFAGVTAVFAGSVVLAGGAAVADAAGVQVDANGTLQLAASETIGFLSNTPGSAGTVDLQANTLTTGDATDTLFSGVIGGTGGLTKVGTGEFRLDGANTFTGPTLVDVGTLFPSAPGALTGTPTLTVTPGATLRLGLNLGATPALTIGGPGVGGNGALIVPAGTTRTIATPITLTTATSIGGDGDLIVTGVVSGAGALTKVGTGTTTLSPTTPNTYTGTTTVAAGTLATTEATALGATTAVTVTPGATLQLGASPTTPVPITVGGPGVGGNGALTAPAGQTVTNAGPITLNGDTNIGGAGTLILTGVISNITAGITKVGTGSTTLSGANTYGGITTVAAGTLVANNPTALGSLVADTTVAAGATLDVRAVLGVEGITVAGTGVGGNGALISGVGPTAGPPATPGSTGTVAGAVTLTAATSIGGPGALTVTGVISGAQPLTKVGAGSTVLTGANTYTGATTISAGILEVNGTQGTSAVTVTAGSLFGRGTVGAITTAPAAIVAPGSSNSTPNETLRAGNTNLTGARFFTSLDGTGAGTAYRLDVTGTVNLGNAQLGIDDVLGTPTANQTFVVIANDGTDAVTGTFQGLAEGATVRSGTRTFAVSYVGGTGNDVTLRLVGGSLPRTMVVGGATNGTAPLYTPNAAGQYATTPTATLTPFPGFAGNVRSAQADVNGDGTPDTVFVTGPGTPIRMTVISGVDNTTVLVPPTAPFAGSEGFTGGGFVAAANLDGQGGAEWAVTPDQGGGPRVTIFSLTGGAAVVRANFLGIDNPVFRGGARPALGDVNNDGTPDLAVAAGFLGGPQVALFNGTTLLGGTPTRLIPDFFAFPGTDATNLRNGSFVAIGDLNGDGFADLIFGGGPGGAPRVFALSGQLVSANNVAGAQAAPVSNFFVAGDATNRGGVRVGVADADADGRADLLAGSGEGNPARVRVYLGKNITSASEPTTVQDLTPFGGAVLANGVFVG